MDIEQGIHVSRVSLVDSTTQKPVKVLEGYVLDPDTGEYRKVRVSKKTLTEIPKPIPEPRERLGKFFKQTIITRQARISGKIRHLSRDCFKNIVQG